MKLISIGVAIAVLGLALYSPMDVEAKDGAASRLVGGYFLGAQIVALPITIVLTLVLVIVLYLIFPGILGWLILDIALVPPIVICDLIYFGRGNPPGFSRLLTDVIIGMCIAGAIEIIGGLILGVILGEMIGLIVGLPFGLIGALLALLL
jgi:hypothetical protein